MRCGVMLVGCVLSTYVVVNTAQRRETGRQCFDGLDNDHDHTISITRPHYDHDHNTTQATGLDNAHSATT